MLHVFVVVTLDFAAKIEHVAVGGINSYELVKVREKQSLCTPGPVLFKNVEAYYHTAPGS